MRSFFPILTAAAVFLSIPSTHAFVAPTTSIIGVGRIAIPERCRSQIQLSAIKQLPSSSHDVSDDAPTPSLQKTVISTLAAASILLGAASSAFAVSGGGLDYAGLNISEQNFSNGNYKGKDFTQTIAKFADFSKSNLQGCRFFGSVLVDANFEGADARGVSFEKCQLDNTNLKNINASGGYFSQSLLDAKTLEGGDFTDASIPEKTQMLVCEREDTKGTNPMTGVDTRESLMCLD